MQLDMYAYINFVSISSEPYCTSLNIIMPAHHYLFATNTGYFEVQVEWLTHAQKDLKYAEARIAALLTGNDELFGQYFERSFGHC